MTYRRLLAWIFAFTIGGRAVVSPAAAHSGTTHAGTPHWLLFVLCLGGIGVIVLTVTAARRDLVRLSFAAPFIVGGALSAVFGGIGLVEIQVVANSPPQLTELYPVFGFIVGGLLSVGGFLIVRLRWPQKPQYAILCLLLSAWIVYPSALQNQGYHNPLGYLIALSLPLVLVFIIWTDGRAILQSLRLQTMPKVTGISAGLLTSVFFAFSAGTMSINPDYGVNAPTETFITPFTVASPLVMWPAIEFYVPMVPLSGYISIGTLLLMGILGGLVGLNVAVVTQQWSAVGSFAGKQLFTGSLAASGATACCCCAPAFYGVLSVLFGSAVTPVYWSFMVPSSPVGGMFFAGSVLLLLGSFLTSTGSATENATVLGSTSN
ncbi:hypothetical protein [Halocatena marina]|uniref:Uncharacterized protein n=1 Tax=Halocatena marina TaxID=2934937 RepID=A0ABD5YKZ8_9EURY|nr:hypothetical protein [Halocatena marina]